MKKLLLACTLTLVSTGSFAAAAAIGDTTATGPTGGATDVTPALCGFLKETVTLASSKGVFGGYDCTTTEFGIGAGALKGKKIVYSIGSKGGKVLETSGTVPTSALATGAATTAKTNSSSGS